MLLLLPVRQRPEQRVRDANKRCVAGRSRSVNKVHFVFWNDNTEMVEAFNVLHVGLSFERKAIYC